jgi:glycerol-3-phosphate acyltransferase PlsY
MGVKWGIAVGLGDIIKGIVAVYLSEFLAASVFHFDPNSARIFGGVFAIVGHCLPIYFHFKGGKGVMTTCSVILFVDWQVGLVAFAIFIVTVLLFRMISLGSILACTSLPLTSWLLFHRETHFCLIWAVVALAIAILHRNNIKRIIQGTESKVFTHKKKT